MAVSTSQPPCGGHGHYKEKFNVVKEGVLIEWTICGYCDERQ